MHWRATMNSFRLTTVKNTMPLIYVHSFRLCQPLLFGWVPIIVFKSRPGFVNVQNWKNSVKKLNTTIMFPFYILQRVCSTCKLIKKKKTQICLKWINIVKKQQHIFKIFYMWMLCITLKERNSKRLCRRGIHQSHLWQNGHDFFL